MNPQQEKICLALIGATVLWLAFCFSCATAETETVTEDEPIKIVHAEGRYSVSATLQFDECSILGTGFSGDWYVKQISLEPAWILLFLNSSSTGAYVKSSTPESFSYEAWDWSWCAVHIMQSWTQVYDASGFEGRIDLTLEEWCDEGSPVKCDASLSTVGVREYF